LSFETNSRNAIIFVPVLKKIVQFNNKKGYFQTKFKEKSGGCPADMANRPFSF
jgi:hypothetical protein